MKSKEEIRKFDLCVIGGGPSGYAAAMRAIDFGKKVLLVEKDKLGGAGLYNGALSSKAMWEYSKKVSEIRQEVPGYEVKFEDVRKVMNEAVFERKVQMSVHARLLEHQKSNRLFFYERGTGKLLDRNRVSISGKGGEKIIYADHILLATGSRPRKLDNVTVDEQHILTSDGISNLEDFPSSLVILGAGVVGCEFATIFSNFGKTKVFLIDKADRILPFEDEDVSQIVTENFRAKGVTVHSNANLVRMERVEGKVEYELQYKDGKREIVRVDKALISIGRVQNTENIGIKEAGIAVNERGAIVYNDTRTSVPNIYIAGDLTSDLALVNVGEREGRHAVVRMFGPPIEPLTYNNISTIMFLDPEVAAVGISEQEAVQKKMAVKVVKMDYSCVARAIAMRKTNGFFKIIVSDDKDMKILGMRAVGEHASSAIQAVALLIYMNMGVEELAHMLHPHPSIIEGIQECMRMLLGKSIYKPSVFKDKLKAYRCREGLCTPLEYL